MQSVRGESGADGSFPIVGEPDRADRTAVYLWHAAAPERRAPQAQRPHVTAHLPEPGSASAGEAGGSGPAQVAVAGQ